MQLLVKVLVSMLDPKGLGGISHPFTNGSINFHSSISTHRTVLEILLPSYKTAAVHMRVLCASSLPSAQLQGVTVPLDIYFLAHHFASTSSNTRQGQ